MTDTPATCSLCHRPRRLRCEQGEMSYSDGSSLICPNWNIRLDEIDGMTTEEAEHQAMFDRLCR